MTKKKVRKLLLKILTQRSTIRDITIHSKIILSLTREEMGAMYRYYDIIAFNSAMEVYDDVLFILAKVKSKIGKKKFKEILGIRNKIAREYRNKRKKHEELFRLNNREPKPKLKPILRNRSHNTRLKKERVLDKK